MFSHYFKILRVGGSELEYEMRYKFPRMHMHPKDQTWAELGEELARGGGLGETWRELVVELVADLEDLEETWLLPSSPPPQFIYPYN